MLRGLLPFEGMKPDETCSAQEKRLKTYPEGPCLGPACRNKESSILLKVLSEVPGSLPAFAGPHALKKGLSGSAGCRGENRN